MFVTVSAFGHEPTKPQPHAQVADTADGDTVDETAETPVVKLRALSAITLQPRKPQEEAVTAEIKQRIAELAQIDSPDFGLSGTLTGDTFLPIEGTGQFQAGLLTNHQLKPSVALRRLVELGPAALPFLLESLDDQTATHLKIEHRGGFGGMWFDKEMGHNPANPTEAATVKKVNRKTFLDRENLPSYTIKVGDVCFVAIGQIVGRSYQAVRYQPTACIVINSTTHDAELCRTVRAIWSSKDSYTRLFDALLIDYATEGIFNGHSLDGWWVGADLQTSAALRLLYYFPRESAALIADRLNRLDVKDLLGADSMKKAVANGVWGIYFIKAITWCHEPEIQAALLNVFKRANDPEVLSAVSRSLGPGQSELIRQRLTEAIDKLPKTESDPFGAGYNLLLGLGENGGDQAKPEFARYLNPRSVQRCRTMCHVLRQTRGEWAIELLTPLLNDKRNVGGSSYPVTPGQNKPRLPIRVCDEAAETICARNPAVSFQQQGDHENLDRQIERIRNWIDERHEAN